MLNWHVQLCNRPDQQEPSASWTALSHRVVCRRVAMQCPRSSQILTREQGICEATKLNLSTVRIVEIPEQITSESLLPVLLSGERRNKKVWKKVLKKSLRFLVDILGVVGMLNCG